MWFSVYLLVMLCSSSNDVYWQIFGYISVVTAHSKILSIIAAIQVQDDKFQINPV